MASIRGGRHVIDPPGPKPMDQRQPAGDVLRIQDAAQRQQFVGLDARADLHADWIGDAAEILDVGAVQRPGPLADPSEVRLRLYQPVRRGTRRVCACS